MHFCKTCNNMYYISLGGEDGSKLTYYCRNCGEMDEQIALDSVCVSRTNYQNNEKSFGNFVNEYTKYDPTLPRVNNIPCPNEDCISNTEHSGENIKEVLLIRYDNINLKFLYLCSHCETIWK